MLGAQSRLRGAAFGVAKIKITPHKKDETLGACRHGLLSANQKGKRCAATIILGRSHLAMIGGEQDAGADFVHSSTEATMDIPTSAGLVRVTTTITTTVMIIEAAASATIRTSTAASGNPPRR